MLYSHIIDIIRLSLSGGSAQSLGFGVVDFNGKPGGIYIGNNMELGFMGIYVSVLGLACEVGKE